MCGIPEQEKLSIPSSLPSVCTINRLWCVFYYMSPVSPGGLFRVSWLKNKAKFLPLLCPYFHWVSAQNFSPQIVFIYRCIWDFLHNFLLSSKSLLSNTSRLALGFPFIMCSSTCKLANMHTCIITSLFFHTIPFLLAILSASLFFESDPS